MCHEEISVDTQGLWTILNIIFSNQTIKDISFERVPPGGQTADEPMTVAGYTVDLISQRRRHPVINLLTSDL